MIDRSAHPCKPPPPSISRDSKDYKPHRPRCRVKEANPGRETGAGSYHNFEPTRHVVLRCVTYCYIARTWTDIMVGLGSFDLQFTKFASLLEVLSLRRVISSSWNCCLDSTVVCIPSQVVPGTGFHDAVVWYACSSLVERYVVSVSVFIIPQPGVTS